MSSIKRRIDRSVMRKKRPLFILVSMVLVLSSCTSHLEDAKFYYVQAQEYSRTYRTEIAIGSYKKSLEEAKKEVEKSPSSQALMLKGLTELHLNLWEDAEQSFLAAFSYGFDLGQEWAESVSLFGLAAAMQELGLSQSAFQIYAHLVDKSKLKPVTIFAAQKYTDMALQRALREEKNQEERLLAGLFREVEKLANRDLSCGFYHYLQAQILGHMSDFRRSFEECVMAKELGLPTQEIFRDNDLQIIFCFQRLKQKLPPADWEEFQTLYLQWSQRWNWPGPETPDWKKR
jgi:tetratricopeptide (TPR) repeat protein